MIVGQVSASNQAVIPVVLQASNGQTITVSAAIDTGFTDFLTLPQAVINVLQLTFITTRTFLLGNNNAVSFDIYRAVVVWDGVDRNIVVLASNTPSLVGMALLKGYRLYIDVVDGGEVRIELRP